MMVSVLLQRWSHGDEIARDQLMPMIYERLREPVLLAQRVEDVASLVQDAYDNLVGEPNQWRHRIHFLAVTARAIRCLLMDHAEGQVDLVGMARAVRKLSSADPRKAELLEMLYFAGMTLEECGVSLGISTTTVHREATGAKAWLRREMAGRLAAFSADA
ncbi:MAG: hypothetical protein JST65_11805 [Acidobacteria bacterium]|nr:hypothetical protein [Acidobacteriota bacterium]